jgi:hypothetical protein
VGDEFATEKVDEQQRTRLDRFRHRAELGRDDANMCILCKFLAAAARAGAEAGAAERLLDHCIHLL